MRSLEDAVFAAAAARDMRAATGATQRALRDGRTVDSVLDALVAVQVRVGERWYSDEWSVADEHAATAIVDAALAVVDGFVEPPAPEDRPRSIVVACPEGEWHALPARMLATELRSLGADVVFLGSSMPADHLARDVDALRPEVVALSASTALSLGAAAACIDAVREVGVPVVVGGRALGRSDRRARALGADGWGTDAIGVLDRARWAPETAAAEATRQERGLAFLRCELGRPAAVDAAMDVLGQRVHAMAQLDRHERSRTRQELEHVLRVAEAAILVDDPSLFADHVAWLGPLLAARRVPVGSVRTSLAVLHEVVDDDELRSVLGAATESSVQS